MSNVSGASVDVVIHGKPYILEPLRFEDLEWLELKLRARCIETARLSVENCDDPRIVKQTMDTAFEQANSIDIFGSIKSLFTPMGMTWILWRTAHRLNPGITIDVVSSWVRDPDAMQQITPYLTLLAGVKKNLTTTKTPETIPGAR